MIKIEINKERCKGCQLCIEFCPRKVLAISEERETNKEGNRFAKVIKERDCTGCANCAVICPDVCIKINSID